MKKAQDLHFQSIGKLSQQIEKKKINASLLEECCKGQIEKNRKIYAYPAVVGIAELHSSATKFGFRSVNPIETPKVCPCCLCRVDCQSLELCMDTTDITAEMKLGYEQFKIPEGVAMFFSFLKSAMYYLLLLSAVFAIFSGISNVGSSNAACSSDPTLNFCQSSLQALLNRNNLPQSTVEDALFLSMVVIAIVYFAVYRRKQFQLHAFISNDQINEADFSVMISNIPLVDFPKNGEAKLKQSEFLYRKHLETYLEEKVKEWVENSPNWAKSEGTNQADFMDMLGGNQGSLKSDQIVKSISLCYDLTRMNKIEQARNSLMDKKIEEEEGNQLIEEQNQDRFSSIPKQVDFINDCSLVLNQQMAIDSSILFNITHFVGYAFVSFQYQHYRQYFLDTQEANHKAFNYNGNYLSFHIPQNPTHVKWSNLLLQNSEKNLRQIHSLISFAFLLFFSLTVILASNFFLFPQLLNVFMNKMAYFTCQSLFVHALNLWLEQLVKSSLRHQQHKTKAKQYKVYIIRTVILDIIHSIGILYGSAAVVLDHTNLPLLSFIHMLVRVGLSILWNIFLPSALWKSLKNWRRYRHLSKTDTVKTFQIKLNKQFELVAFNIPSKYSFYISTVYYAVFNLYQSPFLVVFVLLAICIIFWIDKHNLFRRLSLKIEVNFDIAQYATKLHQGSLFIAGLGYLTQSSMSRNTVSVLVWIGFAFTLVYLFSILMASGKLSKLLFGRTQALKKSYSNCLLQGKFKETYWTQNPISRLIDESSVTGKEPVTNPALKRIYLDVNSLHL